MKLLKRLIAFAVVAIIVLPCFVAKSKQDKPMILDYLGKSEKKEIPEWVRMFAYGERKELVESLGLSKSEKVFVCETHGDTLKDCIEDMVFEIPSSVMQSLAAEVARAKSQHITDIMISDCGFAKQANSIVYSENDNREIMNQAISVNTRFYKNVIKNVDSFWIKWKRLDTETKSTLEEYILYCVAIIENDVFEKLISDMIDITNNQDSIGEEFLSDFIANIQDDGEIEVKDTAYIVTTGDLHKQKGAWFSRFWQAEFNGIGIDAKIINSEKKITNDDFLNFAAMLRLE